jgi:hypothetical protein
MATHSRIGLLQSHGKLLYQYEAIEAYSRIL